MSGEFEDNVVVVTGGARGIGRACAEAFVAEGAHVALLDVAADLTRQTATDLSTNGTTCVAVECDVSTTSDVARAFAEVEERFGRLDVLVNNAGIGGAGRTDQLAEEAWDAVVDVILKGTFLCSQHAARKMIAQGSGAIVNVASMMGMTFFPNRAAYCSAKAGVLALTKVTANEWAPDGVRVNAVAPGYVMTAIMETAIAEGIHEPDRIEAWTPLARLGQPDEVAAAVRYLASDAAGFVTGHTLVIDGGFTSYGAWWPPTERRP